MKKVLFSLLTFISLSSFGQIIVQPGVGLATSGFLHPIGEVDAGWAFKPDASGHVYQATMGWQFNPAIDKSIFTIKGGVSVKDWTLKAGLGAVNRKYKEYVSSYSTLVLGAERYIPKWETEIYKVYYGADLVDGNIYAKIGLRFVHHLK